MTISAQVERTGARPDAHVGADRLSAAAEAEHGDLAAQIRAALERLPSAATATIRIRHDDTDTPAIAAAEIWTFPDEAEAARCVYALPAAIGMLMGTVEQMLGQAGVSYPRADLGLRARWRRLPPVEGQGIGHELVVSAPDHPHRRAASGSLEPGHG